MSLSTKALLANLRISQWGNRRFDKTATTTVEVEHNTGKRVGNYNKKLLSGAPELEEVQRLANGIRQFFYDQTLPWHADGSRILSSKNYMSFMHAFRLKRGQFEYAVEQFKAAYPRLVEQDRMRLGELWRETDYPSRAYIDQAFGCDVTFMPVPEVGDFRVEIDASEKQAFEKRMRETQEMAVQDCWRRLHEVISKAASRLQDPDAVFRDTLIENIREVCELLPKLNVSEDTALDASLAAVKGIVDGCSAEQCRNNPSKRDEVSSKLGSIADKMSAFMGGGAT